MARKVNPETLLFTQDSIKNTFKVPREDERIDNAVDSILEGNTRASDFPSLRVVDYDGRLWSLDNRRLWVFKKAQVRRITVNVSHWKHSRFKELIERRRELQKRILQPRYWPRVRGPCRQHFHSPAAPYQLFDLKRVPVNPTPKASTYEDNTRPLLSKQNVRIPESELDRARTQNSRKVGRDAAASVMRCGDAVADTLPVLDVDTVHDSPNAQDGKENRPVGFAPEATDHDSSDAQDGQENGPAGFAPEATVKSPHDASVSDISDDKSDGQEEFLPESARNSRSTPAGFWDMFTRPGRWFFQKVDEFWDMFTRSVKYVYEKLVGAGRWVFQKVDEFWDMFTSRPEYDKQKVVKGMELVDRKVVSDLTYLFKLFRL